MRINHAFRITNLLSNPNTFNTSKEIYKACNHSFIAFKMKLILLKNKNIHKNCKLHQKEIILKPQWVFNK